MATIVTAKPAIVLEDQSDSLSYIYDEIETSHKDGGERGGHNLYNSSVGTGLYESIAGSILNLARCKAGEDFRGRSKEGGGNLEDLYSICHKSKKLNSRYN